MSRISMVEDAQATAEQQREIDYQVAHNGRMTNMKRTLLHSLPSYHAYMEWYTLRDEIEPFIGPRGVIVFSNAISIQSDCLICSTFFRRYLIDAGEDPENLVYSDVEQLLVDYGRQLSKDANGVSDELFARLQAQFDEKQIVALTAFAGIMIATNMLNNALRVRLDDVLLTYRDTAKFGAEA